MTHRGADPARTLQKVNDPALKYTDLIRPGTFNPNVVRYPLQRVWVNEAELD